MPSLSFMVGGCAPLEPEVLTFEVRAHSLDATERCRVPTNATLELHALGPFPVTNLGAEALPYDASNRTLRFPDDARGVEAMARADDREWLGVSERLGESGIDVLLWERSVGCELYDSTTKGYPAAGGGQAVGYSPETGVLLVSGGDVATGAASGSLTFDSGTGASDRPPGLSFRQARAYATVTPFGSKLLLAGGENPLDTDVPSDRETRRTAAVYDPALGGFELDTIDLELARTRHAAVVLANGETLLVGGVRSRGDGTTVVVPQLEAVSPSTRRSRIDGLAVLARARLEPVVLRLSDDRILVGGGRRVSGEPEASLEWFSPDASTSIDPGIVDTLAPRHHRAFVALPGGGALTVGGCAPADEQSDACRAACGDGFGCPAPEPSASWIALNGETTSVTLEQPPDCPEPFSPEKPFSPERVLLAPGSDGAPWLFAFDEDLDPPCRRAFRFEPWERDPKFGVVSPDIVRWPDPRRPLTSLGPDAFVWLSTDDPPFLVGMRAGTRGPLSQNETLLGSDPSAQLVPLHLAPDRTPTILPFALFDARDNRLLLDPRRSDAEPPPVTVFVTDARYDDVTLSVGFFGDGPPLVLFGARELGGDECPYPTPPESPLVFTRTGSSVTIEDATGRKTRCTTVPSGPISIAFRAGTTRTTLTSLSIRRK